MGNYASLEITPEEEEMLQRECDDEYNPNF